MTIGNGWKNPRNSSTIEAYHGTQMSPSVQKTLQSNLSLNGDINAMFLVKTCTGAWSRVHVRQVTLHAIKPRSACVHGYHRLLLYWH